MSASILKQFCRKTQKRRFTSFLEAANAARKEPDRPTVFKCAYCQGWHFEEGTRKIEVR